MRHRSLDLIFVSGLALIAIIVAWIGPQNTEQVNSLPIWFAPIGIALALFLPGYSIAAGLFPQFDGAGVLVLSLGLSLASDVVGALLLNMTPWGLTPLSWALLLGSITFIGSLNSAFRRYVQLATWPEPKETTSAPLTWRVAAVFAVAFMILLTAIGVTYSSIHQDEKPFTQLWAIPAISNGSYALQLGIKSQETQEKHFDVYVESDGVKLEEFPDIVVSSGQTWTKTVELEQYPASVIRIYLYPAGDTKNPYRMVQIAPVSFGYVMTPTPTTVSP